MPTKFPSWVMLKVIRGGNKGLASTPKFKPKSWKFGLFAYKCEKRKKLIFALRENIQKTTTCGAAGPFVDWVKLTLKYWLDKINNVFAPVILVIHTLM